MNIVPRASVVFPDSAAVDAVRVQPHTAGAGVGHLCTAEDDDAPSAGSVVTTLLLAGGMLYLVSRGIGVLLLA